MGIDTMDLEPIKALCQEFQVPYEIVPTEIGKILFDIRKETNPCSLCAKLRKGALNNKALEMGCNKIAYAHHKDDLSRRLDVPCFMKAVFTLFLRSPI